MTLKDIDFSVAMYGTTPIIQSNYDVAYTGDESSINLRFAVTDEPDLEGATAIVHLKFADSSHIERALELTESVFSYTLKGTENKHAGVVRADIIITKGGAKFTRAGHKFKIDTSLDASVPLVEFSVDTLDTLVDGAEEWLLQAQIDFGTAQSQRAEEWVADNDARADEFAESQTDRTNAFDASEAARTTDFNASETGRSNTFTVNENAREAAAESGEAARDESFELSEYERTTTFGESEAGRVITFNGSEAGRTIAFNLAEEARSEGYANDHDRAGADHTRAENDHDIALTDQENYVTLLTDLQETINDANENIAEFDVALQNGIVATNIAAELQNLEETYAPDLVTVKAQLEQTLNKSAITLTHMFADNAARDAYFVTNPTELVEQLFVKVGTGYQQYLEGAWQASTAIVAEQLSATNQPIMDTGNYFATDNTNAALQEMGAHKASSENPHGVTKAQVGLGNVDNTSDANKPVSIATQAALNLKADKTTTDGINTRLTAEETATANNKISAVKGKTFADVDSRIEDVEFDTTLMATNLVTNGDFSNGATRWEDRVKTHSMGVTNGELSFTGTGPGGATAGNWVTSNVIASANDSSLFYLTAMVKSASVGNAYIGLGYHISPDFALSTTYSRLSFVASFPNSAEINRRVNLSASNGILVIFDNVLAINLTTTFGAGNEPTAAQMDRLLTQFPNSWFNGTENLFLAKWALNELRRLDSEKATLEERVADAENTLLSLLFM